jgi:hypothetical protein
MEKRDYSAAFQDFRLKKEMIQNSYLRIASEIEPKVVNILPLESYIHLTGKHNNLKIYGSEEFHKKLCPLLYQETVSAKNLLALFPYANNSTISKDFNIFKKQFWDWIKEYSFEKDWIIESGLVTLAYRREAHLKGKNQPEALITRGTCVVHDGLSINAEKEIGLNEKMSIYKENWTEFENRIKEKMKELKNLYIEMSGNHKFKTKEFDDEKLKWLAYWNIKKMSARDIVKEIEVKCPNQSWLREKAFEGQVKYVRDEIHKLSTFDLPVRKGRVKFKKNVKRG